MRIVSDKFLSDLKEVLRDVTHVHFDDCASKDDYTKDCDCGADLVREKLKKLRVALNNDNSFRYSGATH